VKKKTIQEPMCHLHRRLFYFSQYLAVSRAVIGYPSWQDGAILPARDTGYIPQGTFIMLWCFIPYNKSFIDQACSVKIAGYWPRSFFACLWTSTSVHKHAKKELGQYPAILTSRLVNNPYIMLCKP